MSTAVNLGVWRDRTNLFISYRSSYAHHPTSTSRRTARFGGEDDSERAGLMSNIDDANSGDAVIEMDVLPPRWLDVQDEIGTHLDDIAGRMRRLEALHARHVLPGFDDEAEKAAEERDIEALTQEITRGFGACQRAIKRIDAMLREQASHSANGQASAADTTMARNLQISLAGRVGDVSTLFRKKQAAYLKKMRSLGGLTAPVDGAAGMPAANPYTDPAMQDEATDRHSAQSTLQQTAQVRRRTGALDSAIATREREIESIAQGVIDLSNIFQELNSMVIDQGSLLDRVDYNVERTAEHVIAADKELKTATTYQKKGTRRLIILLLLLLVVGMLILLLVKPKGRRSSLSPTPAPGTGSPNAPPANGGGPPPADANAPPSVRDIGDVFSRITQPQEARADSVSEGDEIGRRYSRSPWEWKQRRRRRMEGGS